MSITIDLEDFEGYQGLSTPFKRELVPVLIDRTQPLPLPCWLWSKEAQQWMKCKELASKQLFSAGNINEDWTHRLPGHLNHRVVHGIRPPEPRPPSSWASGVSAG